MAAVVVCSVLISLFWGALLGGRRAASVGSPRTGRAVAIASFVLLAAYTVLALPIAALLEPPGCDSDCGRGEGFGGVLAWVLLACFALGALVTHRRRSAASHRSARTEAEASSPWTIVLEDWDRPIMRRTPKRVDSRAGDTGRRDRGDQ